MQEILWILKNIAAAGGKYKEIVLENKYYIAQAGKEHPNHKEIAVECEDMLKMTCDES